MFSSAPFMAKFIFNIGKGNSDVNELFLKHLWRIKLHAFTRAHCILIAFCQHHELLWKIVVLIHVSSSKIKGLECWKIWIFFYFAQRCQKWPSFFICLLILMKLFEQKFSKRRTRTWHFKFHIDVTNAFLVDTKAKVTLENLFNI